MRGPEREKEPPVFTATKKVLEVRILAEDLLTFLAPIAPKGEIQKLALIWKQTHDLQWMPEVQQMNRFSLRSRRTLERFKRKYRLGHLRTIR